MTGIDETEDECERYWELTDRRASAEPLDAEEVAFLSRHRWSCPHCAADAALSAAAADLDQGGPARPLREEERERWVAQVLHAARALGRGGEGGETLRADLPPDRPETPVRPAAAAGGAGPTRWPWIAAAALAGATAVVLALLWASTPTAGAVPEKAGDVRLSLVEGAVTVDHAARSTGDRWPIASTLDVPAGRAAVLLCGRAEVFFAAGSRGRLLEHGPRRCNVGLEAGRIVVDARGLLPGATLTVSTLAGQVRVTGTVFAVEVLDPQVEVRVLEGEVELAAPFLPDRVLHARHAARLGQDRERPLLPGEEEQDRRLAGLDQPVTLPAVAAAPGGPAVTPSVEVVVAGVRDLPPPPSQPASPPRPSPDAVRSVSAAPEAHVGGRRPPEDGDGPQPADLLAAAREWRMSQDWSGSAAAYEELLTRFPNTAEARLALVPLGQIRLEHLGDPAGALQAFDDYLSGPPAALEEDAAWGRIRALRALGRAAEEREAVRAFLSRHPGSLWAEQATARLAELEEEP